MMKRSVRIKAIVELKEMQAKDAMRAMGVSQRKLQGMQAQLESLKHYRQQYQEQFHRLSGKGMTVSQLMEFRSFVDKLDKAIAGQEHSVRGVQAEVAMKKKLWEAIHNQTSSLQKVCDAARRTEKKQEDKLEQSEQDEWAARFVKERSVLQTTSEKNQPDLEAKVTGDRI
ncbi:flagellar export protein FliJ [Methylosarcina fibrata]|uniref:flagellar export protein FliJ n=1 Tax=Methylosarcina fibrata TaxID=105972 RepID=UPI0003A6E5A4|nr:flagellar export protein FliJ [Methylosarcina fibrata]